jgi:hypothetical protein
MPLPSPKYGDEIWDGTTPKSRPNTNVFKGADAEIGNRHSAEIIALEEELFGIQEELDILRNPGAANSVLGVKDDQSGLEYKVFVAGTGMVISHSPESITFTATGGGGGATIQIVATAGETLALGDAVYISTVDGKTYKAQADTANGSEVMGFCDKAAVLNDVIGINPIGPFTNPIWFLTAGTRYYLSPITAGAITSTAPSTPGQYIVPLCVASEATKISISILAKIKL